LHTLRGHAGKVLGVAFAVDDQAVLSIGDDATVRAWRCRDGEPLRTWVFADATLAALAACRQSPDIFVAERGGNVRRLDLNSDEVMEVFQVPGPVLSMAISPDESRLAIGGASTIALMNLDASSNESGGVGWKRLDGHTETVLSVRFDSTSQRLISTSIDRTIKLWDAASGQELLSLSGLDVEANGAAIFIRDNQRIVQANRNQLYVWSAERQVRGQDDGEQQREWHRRRAAIAADRANWYGVSFHANQSLRFEPDDPSAIDRRADALFHLDRWSDAIAGLEEAIRRDESRATHYRLALCYLASDNVSRYRELCGRLWQDGARIGDTGILNRITWTCMLHPSSGVEGERILELLQANVAAHAAAEYLNTLGLAYYRAGHFREAIETLNRCVALEHPGTLPYDWLFLALAHHALDDAEQANAFLHRAQSWYDEQIGLWEAGRPVDPVFADHVRLEFRLLLREANATMDPGEKRLP
jgi:tetratricopeptide (TPR) repeat protein